MMAPGSGLPKTSSNVTVNDPDAAPRTTDTAIVCPPITEAEIVVDERPAAEATKVCTPES